MAETTSSTRKKQIKTISTELLHGKLPPQAVDLEEAVLGALMLDKDAVANVIDILHPECFYKEAHQRVYDAIHTLFHQTQPVDILTVTQQLRKKGELEIAGGAYYITQLTNRVASAANIEFHSRIILQKYIQRELIRISTETITNSYEETSDVLELLDNAERSLFSLAEGNIRKNYEDMHNLITKAIKEIETAAKQTAGVTGVQSGFSELDRVTAGWQKSDLIIIAARPGMGKTAFTLSMTLNAAVKFKRAVAFFSCEMSSLQLVNRLISSESEINSEKIKKGSLVDHEWAQLNSKIAPLTKAPIYIDDTPALNIFELRAKCRRLVSEKKVELVIIDYLQLMTVGGNDNRNGNREQEISTISRSLKSIAKELNIPIIALSQLSRAVESRGGSKKPQLSDLRESGAIEQDADMVLFIYRPEYYGLTEDEEGRPTTNSAEIIVAKNRNGALKSVYLRFLGHLTKFVDLEEFDYIDESLSLGEGQKQLGPNRIDYMQPNPNVDHDRITRRSKLNDMDDGDVPF